MLDYSGVPVSELVNLDYKQNIQEKLTTSYLVVPLHIHVMHTTRLPELPGDDSAIIFCRHARARSTFSGSIADRLFRRTRFYLITEGFRGIRKRAGLFGRRRQA